MDPFRRQVAGPAVEDVRDLLHAPEPRGDPLAAAGVAQLPQELAVAQLAAVLDVLLPLRGDLADQVAHGDEDPHLALGVPEGRQRPRDVGGLRGRQDLVADDDRAVPVPDPLGERIPGADGLTLEAAPGQAHQVERREELSVEAVGRVEQSLLGEGLAVAEQHVLEVRRARLRSADVEVDRTLGGGFGHGDSSQRASRVRTATASVAGSCRAEPGHRTVPAPLGARSAGSPWRA